MAILGIEIGGAKLQLGVSAGDEADLQAIERRQVDQARGAAGILAAIEDAIRVLPMDRIEAAGIGFGGPVDSEAGRVRLSHHVEGWENFPLVDWLRERIDAPVALVNDCDAAALGESRWGAGRGRRSIFYVTVGTGIGGGHVVDGELQGRGRPSVAEIGHMRVSRRSKADDIVESYASGTGIARRAIALLQASPDRDSALRRLDKPIETIRGEDIAAAALAGDALADEVLDSAARVLGWAIGQTVTLLAPEAVVVGGGVSQIQRRFFFDRVENAARELAFPPLRDSFDFLPAELGDEVVVHGAIAAAK